MLPQGLYTALITPFKEGKVDYESLSKILQIQLDANVPAIVLCGTTGESPTISDDEKFEIAKFTSEFLKQSKMKIIVGTGGNDTIKSGLLTKRISELNVDGFLVVSPYYNKANSEGLYLHFKHIAEQTEKPIILYNVPSRTAVNIPDELTAKLANEVKNIIGLKDASGDLARVPSLRSKVSSTFLLLSGEDATALAFNASGGNGIISVVSNIAPKLVMALQEASLKRTNLEQTFSLQEKICKIADVLFAEVNPIPVKYAMHLMGHCMSEYRLPLCKPSKPTIDKIGEILNLC